LLLPTFSFQIMEHKYAYQLPGVYRNLHILFEDFQWCLKNTVTSKRRYIKLWVFKIISSYFIDCFIILTNTYRIWVLWSVAKFMAMISGSLSPQHGMSSGGGWRNSFQISRVYVNILNKQWRTVEKRWSSNLGVGRGANKLLTTKT